MPVVADGGSDRPHPGGRVMDGNVETYKVLFRSGITCDRCHHSGVDVHVARPSHLKLAFLAQYPANFKEQFALKYAFPDRASGIIRVAAALDPVGSMRLTVEDNGIGLAEGLDLRRSGSLGLKLVDSLVRQLDASIEIRRDGGACFSIHFHLPSSGGGN